MVGKYCIMQVILFLCIIGSGLDDLNVSIWHSVRECSLIN